VKIRLRRIVRKIKGKFLLLYIKKNLYVSICCLSLFKKKRCTWKLLKHRFKTNLKKNKLYYFTYFIFYN